MYTIMTKTKKSSPCSLESDSYYWKYNTNDSTILHAFFHLDDNNPSHTFLIVFDSSEANNHVIYSMLKEKGNNYSKSKNEINAFISEVIRIPKNNEEKKRQWTINEKPDMVITDDMKAFVDNELMMRNNKKEQ